MSRWIAIAPALLLVLGIVGAACSSDGSDKKDITVVPAGTPSTQTPSTSDAAAAAIETIIRDQTDANNSKDVDAFVAVFSDSYYHDLGVTRDQARDLVSSFIGVPQVQVTKITAIEVSGDEATAEVASNEGVILSTERYSFVREAGQWRIAKIEELPVQIDAARSVDLTLDEYSFEYDAQQASGGGFAFNVSNAGAQPHEVELMRLPSGIAADQLKDRDSLPAGVEVIGLFGPLDPGEARALAFATDLAPGNYALVCYLSDPNGASHASLGMVKDLTVS